jgi:hypothetical protein
MGLSLTFQAILLICGNYVDISCKLTFVINALLPTKLINFELLYTDRPSKCICAFAHLCICAFVHLYIWAFGHLYFRTFAHLPICTFAHLHICAFAHLHCGEQRHRPFSRQVPPFRHSIECPKASIYYDSLEQCPTLSG